MFGFLKLSDIGKLDSQYRGLQQANTIKDDRFKKLFEERTEQWEWYVLRRGRKVCWFGLVVKSFIDLGEAKS